MTAVTRLAPQRNRALALIRVSKERDGMTSPEVQAHAIATFAAANGITIVDTVEGIDESGSRAKSAWWPRLDQAIDRMRSGEIDVILVWRFSRTARHRLRWAVALDSVDSLGGAILSATEPIDSHTASGRFARGMLGELNAYQADLISEGWKETAARRVRAGKPASGRGRLGYVRDSAADTYTPDPETGPLVAELYARIISGQGSAFVTRWLNSTGTRTIHGTLWQNSNLVRYLDRGFPAGLLWVGGELLPGVHPPLIDVETWGAYRAIRLGAPKRSRGAVRMTSGMLRCAGCGGPMNATSSTGGEATYGCARRARGDDSCVARASIQSRFVEEALSAWVLALPARIDVLKAAEAQQRELRTKSIEDRAALARMITRLEQKLAALTMKLIEEKISQQAYDATASAYNADLAALKARHLRAAPAPDGGAYDHLPTLVAGWEAGTSPEGQNLIAKKLVRRIEVRRAAHRGEDWRNRLRIVPRWEPDE